MTGREAIKLWEIYSDVRCVFEEYNDIVLEDDSGWKKVAERLEKMLRDPKCTEIKKELILYTALELERIAKKKSE